VFHNVTQGRRKGIDVSEDRSAFFRIKQPKRDDGMNLVMETLPHFDTSVAAYPRQSRDIPKQL
jgi:hypothetical protein